MTADTLADQIDRLRVMSTIGWWLEWHCPLLWRLWARRYCPRPIGDAATAKQCIAAGYCGCDNRDLRG